jgi:hypothetical protein
MGKALNNKVIALAGRLPQIWQNENTTDTQRKALLRCLVEKVVLDRGEQTWLWSGLCGAAAL